MEWKNRRARAAAEQPPHTGRHTLALPESHQYMGKLRMGENQTKIGTYSSRDPNKEASRMANWIISLSARDTIHIPTFITSWNCWREIRRRQHNSAQRNQQQQQEPWGQQLPQRRQTNDDDNDREFQIASVLLPVQIVYDTTIQNDCLRFVNREVTSNNNNRQQQQQPTVNMWMWRRLQRRQRRRNWWNGKFVENAECFC